jgi:hypothetical protein
MQTTLQVVSNAMSRLPRTLAAVEARSDVARELAYFRKTIADVRSADDLIADQRLLNFVADAFGLGELSRAKGLLRRVLADGTEVGGIASRLIDKSFRDFAATLDFKRLGPMTTQSVAVSEGVPARFIRQRLEQSEGLSNDAVRLALYFDRNAPDVRSPYGVLADKALMQVASTALGLPSSFNSLDIDRQADQIKALVDVRTWNDPYKRKIFVDRFAVRWDLEGRGKPSAPTPLVMSLRSEARFTDSLLLSLQKTTLSR